MLARNGRPVHGWTLVGVTTVLVSPISWDHHWVWIVPVLALLAGLVFTARPIVKACCIVAIAAIAGIMGAWPWKYSGPRAFVPRRGLLGWFVKPPEVTQIAVVHGWQLLTWNLWVVIGIVIYLALVAAAVVTWIKRPRRPLAVVTHDKSPIDALLARADAVLRGGALVGSGVSGSGAPGQQDKSSGSEHANASWSAGHNGEVSGARQGAVSGNGETGRDSKTGDTGTSRPAATAPRPTR
jgi:hypothetical protein